MAKKNYNYGIIEDDKLTYAPNKLIIVIEDAEGRQIKVQVFNGTEEQYRLQGWLPIRKTPSPEPTEEGYYEAHYTKIEGEIVQSWVFVPYEVTV